MKKFIRKNGDIVADERKEKGILKVPTIVMVFCAAAALFSSYRTIVNPAVNRAIIDQKVENRLLFLERNAHADEDYYKATTKSTWDNAEQDKSINSIKADITEIKGDVKLLLKEIRTINQINVR